MILLMSALSRVNLMLVLNRSLLKKEYILINVLKVLASIISLCNLHATFLSKITSRYFTLFTNGMFRPFSVRWGSDSQRLRGYRLSLYRIRKDHIENTSNSCSVLYALFNNEVFTKNLPSRELVY
jgi:hypothetical protein